MKAKHDVIVVARISVAKDNRNELICIDNIECADFDKDHAWISQQGSEMLRIAKVGDIISFKADVKPYVKKDDSVALGLKNIRNVNKRGTLSKKPKINWINEMMRGKVLPKSTFIHLSIVKGTSGNRLSITFAKLSLSEEAIANCEAVNFGLMDNMLFIDLDGSGHKVTKNNRSKTMRATIAVSRLPIKLKELKRVTFEKDKVTIDDNILSIDISEFIETQL